MSQPSPLQVNRQRALALAESGDVQQACDLLEHSIEMGRATLGEDDPEVLATSLQLAGVLRGAGDQMGARRALEEAYAAGQWRHTDADPLILAISFELGVVAEEMENRHEARRAFGRVAAHGPAVLGSDHWQVLHARAYLGEDPPTVRIELPPAGPQFRPADPAVTAPPVQPRVTPPPVPVQPVFQQPTGAPPIQPVFQTSAPPARPAPIQPTYQQPTSAPPVQPGYPQPGYPQPTGAPPIQPVFQTSAPPGHEPAPSYFGGAPGVPSGSVEQPFNPPPQHFPPAVVSAPPVSAPPQSRSSFGLRAPSLFAAIVATLGVVIAVVALVVVLSNRESGTQAADDTPRVKGPAPTDVTMKDYGSSVKLFWTDPANGQASFMITGGHAGEQLRSMGQVGPATTTFDLNGLNADLDYCFSIVAVYSTTEFSPSPQTCTSREHPSSSASPGK